MIREQPSLVSTLNTLFEMSKKSDKKFHSREYKSWQNILQRCTNKNDKDYHYYGGRGINVCDRWKESFENFLADMGKCPEGMTLDRKNNDGDYCKKNCRWATRKEQADNRSSGVKNQAALEGVDTVVIPPVGKEIVVFDIDGTLSILGNRLQYIKKEPKDWDSFYKACGEDLPNRPVVDLCRSLSKDFDIHYVTGRVESVRDLTLNWLAENYLPNQTERLLMRPDADSRDDHEVKPELIAPIRSSIKLIFEDRSSVVKVWREMGIPCLQVADGDF